MLEVPSNVSIKTYCTQMCVPLSCVVHSCTHHFIYGFLLYLVYLLVCCFFFSFCSQVVGLNFSSATSPELLLKTFDHYCEYRRTPNGVVMAPIQLGKWVVLFCDEINLPDLDKYGKCCSGELHNYSAIQ